MQEYSCAVELANESLPDTEVFEAAPININFEKGMLLKSNGFNKNGYDGKGTADIVMKDRADKNFPTQYLMHNVMHEWTHWNLYRYAYAPSGGYDGHYSYNLNPRVSFKEGWCL